MSNPLSISLYMSFCGLEQDSQNSVWFSHQMGEPSRKTIPGRFYCHLRENNNKKKRPQKTEQKKTDGSNLKSQFPEDQGLKKALQGVQQGARSIPVSRWLLNKQRNKKKIISAAAPELLQQKVLYSCVWNVVYFELRLKKKTDKKKGQNMGYNSPNPSKPISQGSYFVSFYGGTKKSHYPPPRIRGKTEPAPLSVFLSSQSGERAEHGRADLTFTDHAHGIGLHIFARHTPPPFWASAHSLLCSGEKQLPWSEGDVGRQPHAKRTRAFTARGLGVHYTYRWRSRSIFLLFTRCFFWRNFPRTAAVS